jgi:hypothetical protein
MQATAGEAGHATPGEANSLVTLTASGAAQDVAAFHAAAGQRQTMGGLFPGNAEIATRQSPLGTVRLQSPAAMAEPGQQMGQFVQQGALDFLLGDAAYRGIKPDFPA